MSEKLSEQGQSIESPENKQEWYEDKNFWIGFFGWFIVNGLLWLPFSGDTYSFMWGIYFIPGNLIILIVFAFKKRLVAMGLLSAFAINFIPVLLMGTVEQAICFAPFFIDF